MKSMKIKNIILWTLAVIPLIMTIIVYPSLPEKIPIHWNAAGKIDRMADKFPSAFTLPCVGILILLLLKFIPRIDPKRKNYELFSSSYYLVQLCVILIFSCGNILTVLVALGFDFLRVDVVVKLLVGILITVLGNQMPKFKHNYFTGIKTPWTLANEEVWFKTHRMGGMMWFISGLIMIALAFVPDVISAVIYTGIILLDTFVPVIYSYIIYKKILKTNGG